MTGDEPRASCQPTRNTSATTASAITSVSHLNTLSPTPDGGAIRSIVDLTTDGSGVATIGMTVSVLHFDFVHALQYTLTQLHRQRRIIQLLRHAFALGQRPFQKLDQLLSFGCVFLLFVNEQPSRARNRI